MRHKYTTSTCKEWIHSQEHYVYKKEDLRPTHLLLVLIMLRFIVLLLPNIYRVLNSVCAALHKKCICIKYTTIFIFTLIFIKGVGS